MQHLDTIVIGAGPAGLTAGFYLAHYGFDTMIFEEKIAGGYAAEIPVLENYPGYIEGISGKNLVDKMVQQCTKTGAQIQQFEKVIGLNVEGGNPIVMTEKSNYSAETVIIASGRRHRELGIPGESQFRGKGVSYCAICDGAFFKEKKVIVVGDDRRAAEVAIFLSRLSSHVKLVCGKEELCAEKILLDDLARQKIEILRETELKEIKGDMKVKSAVLADRTSGITKEIDTDGVFFQLEGIPNSQMARDSGIKVDREGYILVDDRGRTNIDSIYAVGDIVASPEKLVIMATTQAATAALEILRTVKKTN